MTGYLLICTFNCQQFKVHDTLELAKERADSCYKKSYYAISRRCWDIIHLVDSRPSERYVYLAKR